MRVLQVTSEVLGLLCVHLDELRQLIIIVRVEALPTLLGTVAVHPVLVLLLALLLLGRRLLPERAGGTGRKPASDNNLLMPHIHVATFPLAILPSSADKAHLLLSHAAVLVLLGRRHVIIVIIVEVVVIIPGLLLLDTVLLADGLQQARTIDLDTMKRSATSEPTLSDA